MRAGVAKACITPPVGTWQGGYGARTQPCVGVHDDLFARVLVVEGDDSAATRAAIVSVDIVGLTPEVTEAAKRRAEEATGIPASQIAFCASHTHGGPVLRGFVGRDAGPQVDEEYARILVKYLAGAVTAAARETRPVSVRLGRNQAGFNVNRRLRTAQGTAMRPNPEGVVDREVLVLRVDEVEDGEESGGRASGERGQEGSEGSEVRSRQMGHGRPTKPPLAVVFRYTCHATAMGAGNYLITADYPGAAAGTIERAFGGQTTALFLQGCAGNIRPNLTTAEGGFRGADWAELARLGRELAGAAVAAAEHAAFVEPGESGAVGAAGRAFTLPYAPPPSADELRTLVETGRWPAAAGATGATGATGQALNETERQWAARTLEPVNEGRIEAGVPAEVQVFRLGGVWLVALPGEVFVEIGWKTRDAVAEAAGVAPERVIVAAYANGSVGYVPTSAAIPEGGYEVTAYRHAGRPVGYAPEAEEVLAGTAAELAASLR